MHSTIVQPPSLHPCTFTFARLVHVPHALAPSFPASLPPSTPPPPSPPPLEPLAGEPPLDRLPPAFGAPPVESAAGSAIVTKQPETALETSRAMAARADLNT